jgi:hypothetical protein
MTKDLDYFKESKIMACIIRGPGNDDKFWNSNELLEVMGGEATILCTQHDDLDNSPRNVSRDDNLFNVQFEETLLDNRHLEVFAKATKCRIVLLNFFFQE